MIETLKGFPAQVVAVACRGRITRRDYETVLVPAVEEALRRHAKVRLYYRIDPDYSGIAAGAMWEDFKVGMQHLLRWERIAVVTDVDWIRHTIRGFSFVMPGEVRVFPFAEAAAAEAWITGDLAG